MAVRTKHGGVYPFPNELYLALAEKLYKPLLLGENSVLLCPPLYGKDYIVTYMNERTQDRTVVLGRLARRYYFTPPIQIGRSTDGNDVLWMQQFLLALPRPYQGDHTYASLEKHIRSILDDDGLDIVFFTNILESLDDNEIIRLLQLAKRIYFIAPSKIHFVLFLYHRWNEEEFSKIIAPYYSLFQHIIRPPERTDAEIEHFTRYRLSVWHHQLPDDAIDYIVHEAGGIPLFAKATARLATGESLTTLPQIHQLIHNHPEYRERVRVFWETLTERQRNVLTDIVNGKTPADSEVSHLEDMCIIERTSSGLSLRCPTLTRFINPNAPAALADITKRIHLTPAEKHIVETLCKTPGGIVSREAIATILWADKVDEKYSDWALDQAMSRLRRKLETLPPPTPKLVSKKKSGFYLDIL